MRLWNCCWQLEMPSSGARDAVQADAKEAVAGGEGEPLRQVGSCSELEAEEAAAGSTPVDCDRPRARSRERIARGQADGIRGARAGHEGDVRAQLHAAADPQAILRLDARQVFPPVSRSAMG